jgi:hypothetical protein
MHQMYISTIYVTSVMLRPKNMEIRNVMTIKIHKKTKQRAVKWSQIRGRIELCMGDIILCFEMNLNDLIFFLKLNSYPYIQACVS